MAGGREHPVMHVLVAFDESEPAWDALDHAVSTFPDEEITVLHVVDPGDAVYGGVEGGYYDQAMFESSVEAGEALLERAAERAADADVPDVEIALETGRAARTILEYADEHDVDHVVIGSHGRSGVSRVLLGSVAESVARRAEVPVTIIR